MAAPDLYVYSPSALSEKSSARQEAGIGLRELFKSDIRRALRPPVAADILKEVERQAFKSLEPLHSLGSSKQPLMQRSTKAKNVEVQTVSMPTPPREIQEPAYEPPKQPYEPPKMRRCVELEHRDIVGPLKTKVQEARRKIASLDGEVTRLTKAVKKSRMDIWEKQRMDCSVRKEIDHILTEFAGGIPETARAELAKVIEDETLYYAELKVESERYKNAKQRVKYQDKMLQQEREASKGEVHRILQRHPCGEVFLPPMSAMDSDDDSDDDYGRYSREPPSRGAPRNDDKVQLGSSDEEEEQFATRRTPAGGEGPPPPPSQSFRATSHEDDDKSEASSVTSPSSGGGGQSPSHGRIASMMSASKAPGDASDSLPKMDPKRLLLFARSMGRLQERSQRPWTHPWIPTRITSARTSLQARASRPRQDKYYSASLANAGRVS